MVEREKVIRGLEYCTATLKDNAACPAECPYYSKCMEGIARVFLDLMLDALELLSDPDRVRVVRCSDCRFWEPENAEEGDSYGRCRNDYAPCQNQQTDMNWFCADGERGE